MAIQASLRDLKDVENRLEEIEGQHPEAYEKMAELVDEQRYVGYKNFCKILMKEVTPEELKGVD